MLAKFHVMGYGRHGKDTVSEILADNLGLRWVSSSLYASEVIIYPFLKDKYHYETVEDCFNDRHNHRAEWYTLIKNFGQGDPAKFSRILFQNFDIYCGIRNVEEYKASRDENLFDLSIWVDASERVPPEDTSSCTVRKEDADIVIDNNGTIVELIIKVNRLCNFLSKRNTP